MAEKQIVTGGVRLITSGNSWNISLKLDLFMCKIDGCGGEMSRGMIQISLKMFPRALRCQTRLF